MNTTTVLLADYTAPDFLITHSDLEFSLDVSETQCKAVHQVKKNNAPAGENSGEKSGEKSTLVLNCELIKLKSVWIDEVELKPEQWTLKDNLLRLAVSNSRFSVTLTYTIDPSSNTALSGLYQSADMLCSQCEAEGFRRIVPSVDRPDNLATYRVKLIARQAQFPVLLCNGNLIESGVESGSEGEKHFTVWHDPFPKPTYLFAIVAGKLSCMQSVFTTASGKDVALKFYARANDIEKCNHAMASLKKAMRWDEVVYGREYDLDLFNVVAVDDFNMGAMENKSLNVFNTKYVLADSKMASDTDFQNVEGVIAHEYFHNWSGNRVTCRDWFQLSLKEGFTVFRDQEFSADMNSRGVKRIADVNILRTHQFKEDASAMAHPVRPNSYQEINNFYTVTVYNKGAEVVRMLHTLLGAENFSQGSDLYFAKFDGMAVTTDDFVSVMEQAGGRNLSQFKRWYSQAGTPRLKVRDHYDQVTQIYTLDFTQTCPITPDQKDHKDQDQDKQPFLIPLRTSLFSPDGEKLTLTHNDNSTANHTPHNHTETIIEINQTLQTVKFNNIKCRPTPSLLRGFSAPIKLDINLSDEQLKTLLNHDDDPFNKWESAQKIYLKPLIHAVNTIIQGAVPDYSQPPFQFMAQAFAQLLTTKTADKALQAQLLSLPNTEYLSEQFSEIDPHAIELSRAGIKQFLTENCAQALQDCFQNCQTINRGIFNPEQMGARRLRDACLDYLCVKDDGDAQQLCEQLLEKNTCMTDLSAALYQLPRLSHPHKTALLENFYKQWQNEPLVVDIWLKAQAITPAKDTLQTVKKLTQHDAFDYQNPNKVTALIKGFTHGNPSGLHALDGSGYEFLHEWVVKLDPINPQVAARLVSALNNWRRFIPALRTPMKATLLSILNTPSLSSDVTEIVSKSLR